MSEQGSTVTRRRSFAQVPDALVIDHRLSSHAVRVWARLDRYAGRGTGAMPSRLTLAADLHISDVTVKRALSELASTGWISRVREGSSNAWTTVLNDEPRVTGDPRPAAGRPPQGGSVTREWVTGDPLTAPEATSEPTEWVTGDPRNGSQVTRPRKEKVLERRSKSRDHTPPADAFDVPADDPGVTGEPGVTSDPPTLEAVSETDGELPLGIAPRIETTPTAVQVLVGAYVEAIEADGGIATNSQRGAIGKNLKRLIDDDGIELPILLVAAQRAGAKRARTIDPFLGAVSATFHGSTTARHAMFAAWDRNAARLDSRRTA